MVLTIQEATARLDATAEQLAEAKAGLRTNRETTERLLQGFEAATAAVAAAFEAKALGNTPPPHPSEAQVRELKLDVAGHEAAGEKLRQAVAAAEAEHQAAVDGLRVAREAHAIGLRPRRQESFQAAWQTVLDAANECMALDRTIIDLADPRKSTNFSCSAELFGPAAVFLETLREMRWREWPYCIRPEWLPKHGPWTPYKAPEITEALARVRRELGIEGGK